MIEINHKYELVYNELTSLGIGDYLVSKSYKKLLLRSEATEMWRALLNKAEGERNFVVATGFDHDKYDSKNALILLFNHLDQDSAYKFIKTIILDFIASMQSKIDLTELVEALELTSFDSIFLVEIDKAKNDNQQKSLPANKTENLPIAEIKATVKGRRIFIVHGHDEGTLETVARVLEKQNLEPIILKEQPSEGLTIIEKFEANSYSDFAIILLTADDKGNVKSKRKMNLRARQNVIFEMGYFFSLLGRKNVLCLQEEGIEVPSDLGGRMYIKLDSAGKWKYTLIKELKNLQFDVTADKV